MAAAWNINGKVAFTELGDYGVELDARHPHRGVCWMMKPLQFDSLQFIPAASAKEPLQVVDLYVRGTDLIASYDQLPGADVQPQLYWRLLEYAPLQAFGVQLMISMQTSLLHSEPRCTVVSNLEDTRTAVWDRKRLAWNGSEDGPFDLQLPASAEGHITWFSEPKEKYSYLEVVYPDDLVSQHITRGHCESCFFAEHLEKGVIRRGRIAGWIVPNQMLMAGPTAALQLLEFAQREPLPLTT
jgi:hypothetical protein